MRQIIFVFFILMTGCAAQKIIEPISRVPFVEDEYKVLSSIGTATVKGQAFLKTRNGDVKLAAGNEVLLNPVTSYSTNWYEGSYLQGRPMLPELPDQRIEQYIKKQTADSEGRFTFTNVPAGDYYVTTGVFWEVGVVKPYYFYFQKTGGVVSKKITVKDGDVIEFILTR